MFNRSQINTIGVLHSRTTEKNFFSKIPKDILKKILISKNFQDTKSDIAKLLSVIVEPDCQTLTKMLDENPFLLLEAGNVMLATGDTVECVTPYECALGAGDDKVAAIISSYFLKLENGEQEKLRQGARYYSHIDNMLTQTPYDFSFLFNALKNSSMIEIHNINKKNYNSNLGYYLLQFRQYFKPKVIKSGMHFNYANLLVLKNITPEDILSNPTDEHDSNDNERMKFFYKEFGKKFFEKLPGCDQRVFSKGLYYTLKGRNTEYLNFSSENNLFMEKIPNILSLFYGRDNYSQWLNQIYLSKKRTNLLALTAPPINQFTCVVS